VPWIESRLAFNEHTKDGKDFSRVFTYKNHFDKTGKIIKRKVHEASASEGQEWQPYFREEAYYYMSNGLLIKRLGTAISDNSPWMYGLLFDYKFW
jgi:hypothetical protein